MDFFATKNITKVFASVKALTDVSITVKKQSIFGLLGPNGAGKTTLIRIINQITAPDSGEIYLEGRRMKSSDVCFIGTSMKRIIPKKKNWDQAVYLAQLKWS